MIEAFRQLKNMQQGKDLPSPLLAKCNSNLARIAIAFSEQQWGPTESCIIQNPPSIQKISTYE